VAKRAIRAQGLTKTYGTATVVDHIDLDIKQGEIFGLLGPNGAGKTTTILMLLGLTEPTSGRVGVAGFDPNRDAIAVRETVGYLPDNVGFYDDLTARENLSYTARLNRLDRATGTERMTDLLDHVGLAEVADQRVGTYSRGMRQRLGIADALMKNPSIVVLDEPTAAIDPEGAAEIQRLILSLAHRQSMTVLVSSHLLHQMQLICDRVAIFVAGRIVAQGRPSDLAVETSQGRVALELDADVADGALAAALAPLQASELEAEGGQRWRFSVPADRDDDVATSLVAAGIKVRQLRRIGDDLDEVYRRYFESTRSRP